NTLITQLEQEQIDKICNVYFYQGITFDKIVQLPQDATQSKKDRMLDAAISKLVTGNLIVVDSLEILGHSSFLILKRLFVINGNKSSTLHIIKDDYILDPDEYKINTLFYKIIEIEKSYTKQRTDIAKQTREKRGTKLGRKSGQKVKSIFDKHRAKIKRFNALGLSKKKIIECIGVGTPQALGNYIKRTELEQEDTKKLCKAKRKKELQDGWSVGANIMTPTGKIERR
ncbi:MAG: hypothetical protein OEL19_05650, partial [Sulfurimonas sp.]|nr:hypothetical protein [Sulfurimonas sp.]